MAKKTSARFRNKPTGLAASVGRMLGKLAAKRDKLARQLAGVEEEIAQVRRRAEDAAPGGSKAVDGAAGKAAGKRTPMTEATRRKTADAAKARMAAATRIGRKRQG